MPRLGNKRGTAQTKEEACLLHKTRKLEMLSLEAQLQDMAEHAQQLSAIKRQNSLDIFSSHFLIIRCVGLLSRGRANEGG